MSKTKNFITWIITILLSLIFMGAGFAKLSGAGEMVQVFSLFGLPHWFRLAIGGLEVVGALFLLIPILTGCAAFGLSIIMIGAITCHVMFTPLTQGIPAVVAIILLNNIILTRKNIIPEFLHKYLII